MRAAPSLLSLVSLLWLVAACATAEGGPPATATPAGPVVLELFTSQGCSSCPPADRLLGAFARAGTVDGTPVVPLSFHVDYWDDLGWADPYAQPAWTARQHAYAAALGERRVYTPELVVGGAAGVVGSNLVAIAAAIRAAPRPAHLPASATWTRDALEVTATAPAGADVLVAVFEDARTQKIARGENAGATLANHRVVRRLERVATAGARGHVRVALDPAWTGVGAVVFAQQPTMRIVASGLLPPRR